MYYALVLLIILLALVSIHSIPYVYVMRTLLDQESIPLVQSTSPVHRSSPPNSDARVALCCLDSKKNW